MKINNKLIETMPVIMACGKSDSQSITISSDYGETIIPISLRYGINYADYFSISDNRITITSNKIKNILISGQCMCSRGPGGYVSLYVRKNGNTMAMARHQWVDWNGESLVTAPIILDVSQGDYFEIYFGSSVAGTYTLSYGSKATVLTVEAVEIE